MAKFNLFQKVWQAHSVGQLANGQTQLFVGRHLIHEVTSPQAFGMLREKNLPVRYPERTFATVDHIVPTNEVSEPYSDPLADAMIRELRKNCEDFGVTFFDVDTGKQGIVHVVGPEQGLTQPGMTIACGDSHTSTHGAFAALAQGIGTSEVEHVMSTQCLVQNKAKNFAINVSGSLAPGVTAKDLVLAIIGRLGTAGATGHTIEYRGTAIRELSMEARMTLCNMAIEAGARAGLVAVDDTTIEYIAGRPFAPKGEQWDQAVAYWRTLVSDDDAEFDQILDIDASQVAPQVTWGTSPEMVSGVDQQVPDPQSMSDSVQAESARLALDYMGLQPHQPITDIKLDRIFIGSCTNARIEDLRAAAAVIGNGHVANNIKQALVVPGSGLVKAQAEKEGLAQVFIDAGFEWRAAGCSMCLGMNPDQLGNGEHCASTSNRNFEGRQGYGGRTHLVSPAMAAAAAVAGHFVDVREIS